MVRIGFERNGAGAEEGLYDRVLELLGWARAHPITT